MSCCSQREQNNITSFSGGYVYAFMLLCLCSYVIVSLVWTRLHTTHSKLEAIVTNYKSVLNYCCKSTWREAIKHKKNLTVVVQSMDDAISPWIKERWESEASKGNSLRKFKVQTQDNWLNWYFLVQISLPNCARENIFESQCFQMILRLLHAGYKRYYFLKQPLICVCKKEKLSARALLTSTWRRQIHCGSESVKVTFCTWTLCHFVLTNKALMFETSASQTH